jgi:hypothetical protein
MPHRSAGAFWHAPCKLPGMSPSITASRGYHAAGARALVVIATLLVLVVPVEGALQRRQLPHLDQPLGAQLVAATGDASLECVFDDGRPHVGDPRQAIGCRTSTLRIVRPLARPPVRVARRTPQPMPRLYRRLPHASRDAVLPH